MKKLLLVLLFLPCFISPICLSAQTNNARMLSGVNLVTATIYPFVGADATRLTVFSNSSAIAATLPSSLTLGFGAGTAFDVVNNGSGTVTITCSSCLIFSNGTSFATLSLLTGQGAELFGSTSANYYTLASVGGVSSSIGAIGPTAGTAAPVCVVDGVLHANIQACITYLGTLGFPTSGTIWDFAPEDLLTAVFAINNWRGRFILANSLVTGNKCPVTAPFLCLTTEVPQVMPTNLTIEGVGAGGKSNTPFNAASVITFGTLFPAPIGAPTAPSLTCNASGGTLINATYYVQIWEANNLLGLANNANPQSSPGYGAASTETSIACSNGGSAQSITFAMPAALGSGQFIGQDLLVGAAASYNSIASGGETTDKSGVGVTCPGTAGAVDPGGCAITAGTVRITAIPSVTSNNPPPAVGIDLSNALLTLGTGIPLTTQNSFNVKVKNLTVSGCPNNAAQCNGNVPVANQPAVAMNIFLAQEESGPENVIFAGPFTQAGIYSGYKSGNCAIKGVQFPSNDGPNQGTFYNIVIDGRAGGNGGCREISDTTAAMRCSGCAGNTVVVPASILVTGANSALQITSTHIENDVGGDGIQITNGASAFIVVTGFGDSTKSVVHMTATADTVCAMVTKDQKPSNVAILDDATGFTITPGFNVGAQYCNKSNVGSLTPLKLNLQSLAFSATAPTIVSGFGTSPSLFAVNGTAAFTIIVGSGGTATNGVIGLPTATGWWKCDAVDTTTASSTVFITKQIAPTQGNSAALANFNTSGAQAAWVAGDNVHVSCQGH